MSFTQPMIISVILLIAGPVAMAEQTVSESMLLFVSVSGDRQIVVLHFDPNNAQCREVNRTSVPGNPGPLAFNRGRRMLYAADRAGNRIITYSFNVADGSLTQLGAAPTAGNPVYITLDKSGTHLLVACVGTNQAAVHAIDDSTGVAAPPTHQIDTPQYPHAILPDRSNHFIYLPCLQGEAIAQFRFDHVTDKLIPKDPATVAEPKGAGPRHLWQHPTLDVLYTVNENNNTVTVWHINPRGGLERTQAISTLPANFAGETYAADVEVTPNGKLLLASNRGHDSIALFTIDAAGKLAARGHVPTEPYPRDFAIDPTGRFLVVAGEKSGRIAVYRIDDEALTLTPIATQAVGKRPVWVTIAK